MPTLDEILARRQSPYAVTFDEQTRGTPEPRPIPPRPPEQETQAPQPGSLDAIIAQSPELQAIANRPPELQDVTPTVVDLSNIRLRAAESPIWDRLHETPTPMGDPEGRTWGEYFSQKMTRMGETLRSQGFAHPVARNIAIAAEGARKMEQENRAAGRPRDFGEGAAQMVLEGVPLAGSAITALDQRRREQAKAKALSGENLTPDDLQALAEEYSDQLRGATFAGDLASGAVDTTRLAGTAGLGAGAGIVGAGLALATDPGAFLERQSRLNAPIMQPVFDGEGKPTGKVLIYPPKYGEAEAAARAAALQGVDAAIEMGGGAAGRAAGRLGGALGRRMAPEATEQLGGALSKLTQSTPVQAAARVGVHNPLVEYGEEIAQGASAAALGEPGADPAALLDPTSREAQVTAALVGLYGSAPMVAGAPQAITETFREQAANQAYAEMAADAQARTPALEPETRPELPQETPQEVEAQEPAEVPEAPEQPTAAQETPLEEPGQRPDYVPELDDEIGGDIGRLQGTWNRVFGVELGQPTMDDAGRQRLGNIVLESEPVPISRAEAEAHGNPALEGQPKHAWYDPADNTVHLAPSATGEEVLHESWHAVLEPMFASGKPGQGGAGLGLSVGEARAVRMQFKDEAGLAWNDLDAEQQRGYTERFIGAALSRTREMELTNQTPKTLLERAQFKVSQWMRGTLDALGVRNLTVEDVIDRVNYGYGRARRGQAVQQVSGQPRAAARRVAQTPEFRNWFGDSKVVDENGQPMVVYHGTPSKFTVFDANRTDLSPLGNSGGLGMFFSANPKEAAHYSYIGAEPGNIMPAYLAIENPAVIESGSREAQQMHNSKADAKKLRQELQAKGHDGAITHLGEYVAFSPEQIKSATGNVGAFDPNNPDIRAAARGQGPRPELPMRVDLDNEADVEAASEAAREVAYRFGIDFLEEVYGENSRPLYVFEIPEAFEGQEGGISFDNQMIEATSTANLRSQVLKEQNRRKRVMERIQAAEQEHDIKIREYYDNAGQPEYVFDVGDSEVVTPSLSGLGRKVARVRAETAKEEVETEEPPETRAAPRIDVNQTMERISEKAESLGYDVQTRRAGTGTWYLTLENDAGVTATVRVGDHGEVYPPQRGERKIDVSPQGLKAEDALSAIEDLGQIAPFEPSEEFLQAERDARRQEREQREAWAETRKAVPENVQRWFRRQKFNREAAGRAIADALNIPVGNLYPALTSGKNLSKAANEKAVAAQREEVDALLDDTETRAAARQTPSGEYVESRTPAESRARRWWTVGGNLPRDAVRGQERLQGQIQAADTDIRFTARRFRMAMRDAFAPASKVVGKRYWNVPKADLDRVNRALQGDVTAIQSLPKSVQDVVTEMRNKVDAMSRQFIDLGIVEGDLAAAFEENMGVYLTRSYEIFDNPKFEAPKHVQRKVYNLLRSEMPDATPEEVQGKLDALMAVGRLADSAASLFKGGKLGAKDLSMLKRRKDIVPEIRALWGEHTDPLVNWTRTMAKGAATVANQKFLAEVRNAGMGNFFFETETTNERGQFIAPIAADASSSMEPLNGLYTTPEILEAFEKAYEPQSLPTWLRVYMGFNAGVKVSKTVLSTTAQVRNFVSNALIALANSHWDVRKFDDALHATAKDLLGLGPQALEQRVIRYKELRILGEDVRANELRLIFQEATGFSLMSLTRNPASRAGKAALKFATDVYQAGDTFWKVYGFENELQQYRKARPDLSERELEEYVANIVMNIYPTWSRIPSVIRALRRFPLSGSFVSFPSEIVRTTVERAKLTQRELADERTRAIGARRLVGQTVAYSLPTTAGIISAMLLGFSREDREDHREFMAPWDEDADMLYVGGTRENPNVVNLAFSDPFAYLKVPFQVMLRGDGTTKDAMDAAVKTVVPFLGQEILAGKLLQLEANQTDTGHEIYNPQAPYGDQLAAMTAHLWEAFEPGTSTTVRRISRGVKGEQKGRGRRYDAATEIIAATTGQRTASVDTRNSLYFDARDFKSDLSDAERIYTAEVRYSGTATPESIETAWEKAEDRRQKLFAAFQEKAQAARRLGVSDRDVYKILYDAGIPKSSERGMTVRHVLNGVYKPYGRIRK